MSKSSRRMICSVVKNYDEAKEAADGEEILNVYIPVRPSTKKTGSVMCFKPRPILIPSKRYLNFNKLMGKYLKRISKRIGRPYDFGVGLCFIYYAFDRRIGDHVGYIQAVNDILEHYGIFKNDKYITIYNTSDFIHLVGREEVGIRIILYRLRSCVYG